LRSNSDYFVVVSKTAAADGLTAMKIIQDLNTALDGRGGGKDIFAQGGTKRDFDLSEMEGLIRKAISA